MPVHVYVTERTRTEAEGEKKFPKIVVPSVVP
jgi:hypothetical protein